MQKWKRSIDQLLYILTFYPKLKQLFVFYTENFFNSLLNLSFLQQSVLQQ